MLFLLTQRKIFFGLFMTLALSAVIVSAIRHPEKRTSLTGISGADAIHLANMKGWAWANTPQSAGTPQTGTNQGLGWISFNSTNCDSDDNGISDGGPPGCPSAGTTIPRYGVFVDPSTGIFSGNAWIGEESSSGAGSVGWVSFNPSEFTANAASNPSGGCPDPDGICEQANVAISGAFPRVINGWARVLSMRDPLGKDQNSATSEGWIHLSDTRTGGVYPLYQTRIMNQEGEIRGWTWGHDMLGWISFACGSDPSCSMTIPGNPSTDAFDPTPRNLTTSLDSADEADYCQETLGGPADQITFDWASAATSFRIQVDRAPGVTGSGYTNTWEPTSPLTTSGITANRSTILPFAGAGYTSIPGCSTGTCTFNWRVSADNGTAWSPGTLTLTSHDWPLVQFSRNRLDLNPGETVAFSDTSTCYDSGTHSCINPGDTFIWTFENGNPPGSTAKNSNTEFLTNGIKIVTDRVNDGHGHTCTATKAVPVGPIIPGWKEITP